MIKVIDLFSGNDFNPTQIKADGYAGVIFKAGQGMWADVPRYFPEWWNRARQAGLMRGWYWLVDSRYHSSDHIKEMDKFHVFDDVGELGLWADVEKPRMDMTEDEYWKTPYAGPANVIDFIYLAKLRGVDVGVYTGPGAFDLIFGKAHRYDIEYIGKCDLWTAQYNDSISKPDLYGAWTTWVWWQRSEGPDINYFNGTDDDFYNKYGYPPNGGTVYRYTITPKSASVNIRADHSVQSTDIGDLLVGHTAEGDTLWETTGQKWLQIKSLDGAPKSGWVAVIYNNSELCTLIDNGTTPPTDETVNVTVEHNGKTGSATIVLK